MPRKRSVHAGGYTVAGAAKLQSIKLPGRIKCAVCHKVKAFNFFSTIQQNTLRNALAIGDIHDATVEGRVPCVSCTPKQVTELECCICGEVKGLEGFAKAQRRLGEEARCITCVAELNGEAPVEESYRKHLIDVLGDEDSDDDYDTVSNMHESSTFSGDANSQSGVPLSSTYDLNEENLQSPSFSSDCQSSRPSASQAAKGAFVTNTRRIRGVAAPAANSAWQAFSQRNNGESAQSSSGAQFTGYDPQGNAHHVVRPTSTVPTDDSDDDTVADPREQARNARGERDARSRFARPRDQGDRAAPVVVPQYYGGRTVNYDEDDNDDDDWGTI